MKRKIPTPVCFVVKNKNNPGRIGIFYIFIEISFHVSLPWMLLCSVCPSQSSRELQDVGGTTLKMIDSPAG